MENREVVALYVDRVSRQWVVRDLEGRLWCLPATDKAWDERQPFQQDEETELESVPGHYKALLGLSG